MKTMRNALNITADNHELVKAGYIQRIDHQIANRLIVLYAPDHIRSSFIRPAGSTAGHTAAGCPWAGFQRPTLKN